MRLFIAINFNKKTRSRLLALQGKLHLKSSNGSFTLPENLHLTLAFLGECDAVQVDSIKTIIDGINFNPFPIHIESMGRFRRNNGDIWWAGVQRDKPLLTLQRNLMDRLMAAGFIFESRKYIPHITLGRRVVTDLSPWKIEPFEEEISKINLMKSERVEGRLRYRAIY